MFGLSIWELLIILTIVLVVFGTSRFKNLGSDLGGAIKGFRTAIKDDTADDATDPAETTKSQNSETSTEKPNV